MSAPTYDRAEFAALQATLADSWPQMTMRTTTGGPRTLVVLSSMSVEIPDYFDPLLTAYEERYLCLVLILARASNTRVVYLTSQPVLPRLLQYFLELMPGLDAEDLRRRLTVISVGDGSRRPLTAKVLERPRLLDRLRTLVHATEQALILPFVTTDLEARLSVELGIPVYGPDPALRHLGTKSGSRQVFAAAGVAHPAGCEGVRSLADVVAAADDVAARTGCSELMVKTDDNVSGFGNAVLSLGGGRTTERSVLALRPEQPGMTADGFLAMLEASGGIVEQRVIGRRLTSPSVQLRSSPLGEVEVLSTHDQVLGGANGQSYLGCRFPADPAYAQSLVAPALAVGTALADRGVIGRFAVDFVTAEDENGTWHPYAVEINLRNGGTTHPMLTLQALTDGSYDVASGSLLGKHYVATDHLEDPLFARLMPDDLLDVAEEHGLGWDPETGTGIAFHMASAIAVAGIVGVTSIGNSPAEADALYDGAKRALRHAAS